MAETQRTYAASMALLADNTSGDISPADLRDGLYSIGHHPMGQIYVSYGNGSAVTMTDADTWYECNQSTWTASTAINDMFDESAGNGRLTYTGTVPIMVHAVLSASFITSANNVIIRFACGKNGTVDPAGEFVRKIGTGADVGSSATHLMTTMANGDYLSAFVRSDAAAGTLTLQAANIQAVGMVL